jgi:hypothetical protein
MIVARALFFGLCCVALFAGPAVAQLRPLEPIDFRSFGGDPLRVQIGMGVYFDQQASLAGTEGTLWELGEVRTSIRTGRMVMEVSGTLRRRFDDHVIVKEPYGGAHAPPADGRRNDFGDYRVSTVLRLTNDQSAMLATLRFGTRLPTTDNRVGLDRDVTDFFATVGGQTSLRTLALAAEAGVSINGTREASYEQADVMVYAITGELRLATVAPFITVVGQQDFRDWAIRGNEDLAELRAGLRLGHRRWINAVIVRGLTGASPSGGLQISGGAAFGGS